MLNVTETVNLKRRQPVALYALTFLELWDRYSYYGIQAMFILYMSEIFLLPDNKAYGLYGVYTALTFASSVLGGILADRLIGFHRAIISGAALIILANIIMAVDNQLSVTYLGLATMVCGIGLFKPNNSSLVGTFYKNDNTLRDSGFTIFYIGMNIGALLGPIAYGYVAKYYGWHACFITSAIGMTVGVFLLSALKNKLKSSEDKSELKQKDSSKISGLLQNLLFYAGVAVAVLVFTELLYLNDVFRNLLYITGAVVLSILIFTAMRSNYSDRNRLLALTMLSIFSIFFFACSLQTATSLTIFIERYVDRTVFGIQIPTMAFLSLQAFFIIICAPWLAKVWLYFKRYDIEFSVSRKVALGMMFAGLSFIIFSLSAQSVSDSHKASVIGIVLGNLFLGLGELCVLPAVMSNITRFAPEKLKATMMGVFFLALAFSGYFAGLFAQLATPDIPEIPLRSTISGGGFLQVSLIAIFVGAGILLFDSQLNRMLAGTFKPVKPRTLDYS